MTGFLLGSNSSAPVACGYGSPPHQEILPRRHWPTKLGAWLAVATSLVAALTYATPSAAWWPGQRIDDRHCYGDTVDVILRHGITKELKVLVRAPLDAVPVPEWDARSDEPWFGKGACAPEPLIADNLWLYPGETRAVPSIDLREEVTQLQLHYSPSPLLSKTTANYHASYDRRFLLSREYWSKSPFDAGYDWIKTHVKENPSGTYRAPVDITEPSGRRLHVDCAPAARLFMGRDDAHCTVQYWMPGDVWLYYQFMYSRVPIQSWQGFDSQVRAAAERLIVGPVTEDDKSKAGGEVRLGSPERPN